MNAEASMKQPKQLYMLFFAEMWERFSFYGMRALLILFMVKQFLYSDDDAYHIYGAYGALVYTTPFIGGIIADKILGYRKSVMLGGILMAIGHFVMVGPDLTPEGYKWLDEIFFYTALAFLIVGNGFFKPNISSIVGSLYGQNDPRRDAGFTIFYMGVNLGAFLAPLVCGTVGEIWGWGYGFSLAGIGMVAGLIAFGRGQHTLQHGLPPSEEYLKQPSPIGLSNEKSVYLLSLFMVAAAGVLINFHNFMSKGLYVFGIGVLAYILYIAFTKLNKIERQRMFVILILLVFSAMFWAFFEQAGSSITLFTDRNVDKGGVPTSLFQSVNPLFILLFGSAFSAMWLALGKRGKDLSIPAKFVLAIIQLGLGFGALVIGAKTASEGGMVSVVWLLLGYLLQTTGELCLSPVGLSMVTKLAPKTMVAMILGAWYLSSAFAHNLGALIAGYTSTSAYMEKAIEYKPNIGFIGQDTIKFVAYETYIADKTTGAVVTLKKDEKIDTTKHRVDSLFAQEVSLLLNVVATEAELKPNAIPDAYTIRHSIRPDGKVQVNTRVQHLDPFGDLMDIAPTRQPTLGTIQMQGDTMIYTPNAGSVGEDIIEFTLCEREANKFCDRLRIVITIDDKEMHAPVATQTSVEYYVVASTALAKSEPTINVLNYIADADGSNTNIKITQKPSLQKALVGNSKALNSFVTPRKTIQIYSKVFFFIMICSFGAALVLLLLVPVLKSWVHEGKDATKDEA
jgi:POT family proton-dependent oligopeptide transporter